MPTVIILVAIVAAICAGRHASPKTYNPVAGLSDEEYKRRYELGRRRYLEERAALKARKRAWRREHGPWLLLAVVAALLVLVLTVTQPHGLIVIMTLAFYTGLAWVVCWVVRASC